MKISGQSPAPKRPARTVLDTSRKAGTPPGHPLGRIKREERVHPSLRKAKHKHPLGNAVEEEESQDD